MTVKKFLPSIIPNIHNNMNQVAIILISTKVKPLYKWIFRVPETIVCATYGGKHKTVEVTRTTFEKGVRKYCFNI